MTANTFEIPSLSYLHTAPGTLSVASDAVPTKVVITDYSSQTVQCQEVSELDRELVELARSESVTWIDVQGLSNLNILRRIAQLFEIHPLALADIVNVPQRPKFEIHDRHLLFILKMPHLTAAGFRDEQVSLIIGKNHILSFQEDPTLNSFEAVGERIRQGQGKIRRRGADYLAYTLIDSCIDSYFPVLEHYGDKLARLELKATATPDRTTLSEIHDIKRELLAVRRAIWPLRDATNNLLRDGNAYISKPVRAYIRDSYDHAIQVLDLTEIYRELSSSLIDLYLSSVSHRMNEVVQLLTLVSTIFIPLTFIAGIYGMNFNPNTSRWNMPELNWPLGYPLVWLVMVAIASSMIVLFWRKGWLHLAFNNTFE